MDNPSDDDLIVLEFDIKDVPKLLFVLAAGRNRIKQDKVQDEFNKKSLELAENLMKDTCKEYDKIDKKNRKRGKRNEPTSIQECEDYFEKVG